MVVWHLSGLQSLTRHILRRGGWRRKLVRMMKSDVNTEQWQLGGGCGSLSVRQFLITDARKLNSPRAHVVHFDFTSVTENEDSCGFESVQWEISSERFFLFFIFLISRAGSRRAVARTHAAFGHCTLSPQGQSCVLSHLALKDLCLLTWLSNTHTQGGGERNT